MQREDYPIPNYVRPRFKSLNGEWNLELLGENSTKICTCNVPYELGSKNSGVEDILGVRSAVYQKCFELNASEVSGTVLLNFGGVANYSRIYLNDILVAENVGYHHSMVFDVSMVAKEGVNALSVVAERGDDYTLPIGIIGEVWLEFAAKSYFGSVRSYASLMNKTIYVQGAVAGETEGYKVKVEIAYNKKPVVTYEYKAKGVLNLGANLKTQAVFLWQALEPRFYELRLSLYNAQGGLCDQIYTYCAFRDVSLLDNKLYVNGTPTFMRAVEVDGYYPYSGHYYASAKEIAQDYASVLMLGFNTLDFKRYPTPRELYIADKLGLMVRASLNGNRINQDNAQEFEAFASESQMLLNRDFGHPSIIFEVPFEDYNGSALIQSSTYKLLKQTDPTKLVSIRGGDLYETDVYEFKEESNSPDAIEEWLMYRFNGAKLSEKEDLKRRKHKPELLSEQKLRTMPFYVGSIKAGNLRANDHYSEVQFISNFARQAELIMASGAIGFTLSSLVDGEEKNGLLNANRDFKLSREGIAKMRAINKNKAFSEQ
ncbi:MAG: hypothetical protein IJ033_04130 [Clostridia bacterium]|nr:hypothetical protein [Clostridia bacterium]